jgi:hypothetical protein
MILAAASLTLTILILPSFWADLGQILEPRLSRYGLLLPVMEMIGDWLALILIIAAILLFALGLLQGRQNREFLKRITKKRLNVQRMGLPKK